MSGAGQSAHDLVKHFEVEGYVQLPGVLEPGHIQRIKSELADMPMVPANYTSQPTFPAKPPQWHSRAFAELIGHPASTAFLKALLGEDIVFVHGHFVRSHPGQPPMPLRCNAEPYGSTANAWRDSSPVMVRVLFYLDGTGTDRAPLRVIPRSHLSFHGDANPYKRYETHPAELMVPAQAGDAIVFAPRLFHGTYPNSGSGPRELAELLYRPGWARPIGEIEEWDGALVDAAPAIARPFLRSRNTLDRHWEAEVMSKPVDMPAPGMGPARWTG